MIIWINGPFGAGKTTLVEELAKRLDTAITVDPELLEYMLRSVVPPSPSGDFQDLPIWRTLTVRTLQEIRREYARPLLVPLTLVEPQYVDEIFGSLHMPGGFPPTWAVQAPYLVSPVVAPPRSRRRTWRAEAHLAPISVR